MIKIWEDGHQLIPLWFICSMENIHQGIDGESVFFFSFFNTCYKINLYICKKLILVCLRINTFKLLFTHKKSRIVVGEGGGVRNFVLYCSPHIETLLHLPGSQELVLVNFYCWRGHQNGKVRKQKIFIILQGGGYGARVAPSIGSSPCRPCRYLVEIYPPWLWIWIYKRFSGNCEISTDLGSSNLYIMESFID